MNDFVPNPTPPSESKTPLRIASVSYLNARPLIYGLDSLPDRKLLLEVPAKLIDLLRDGRADVALLPVIDYQRLEDLCIVPAGGIGSDGETLTVRIFSKTPVNRIETLACDVESHTSVALARIVLAEHFGIRPEFVELPRGAESKSPARLLIGDKVICEEPVGFEHQLDLGEAWKKLTDLPFVFATWMTRIGTRLGDLPKQLDEAKCQGLAHVEELIERFAIPLGWPREIARQYLTENLKFDVGEKELEAIELFHELAHKHGIIERRRELRVYRD